jgi:hypothetical protein
MRPQLTLNAKSPFQAAVPPVGKGKDPYPVSATPYVASPSSLASVSISERKHNTIRGKSFSRLSPSPSRKTTLPHTHTHIPHHNSVKATSERRPPRIAQPRPPHSHNSLDIHPPCLLLCPAPTPACLDHFPIISCSCHCWTYGVVFYLACYTALCCTTVL